MACDGNATLLSVDIGSGQVTGTYPVGDAPDVLAYDAGAQRLYVAAESGVVTVLDRQHGHWWSPVPRIWPMVPTSWLSTQPPITATTPLPSGSNGHPALLERAPTAMISAVPRR